VESLENQAQVFQASHRPLKISQPQRDFHISTAWAGGAWKSGKPKTGFPLSHPPPAMTMTVPLLQTKTPRKEVGRSAASSFFFLARSPGGPTGFMLILRLENAAQQGLNGRPL
jgi:hypothetical protein